MQSQLSTFEGKFDTVLIFGPPGAGKGTIGKMICSASGAFHLSSGEIFRGIHRDLPAGQLVTSYTDKGLLVPDAVTMEIWHAYVLGLVATNRLWPAHQQLFLDGIPRTVRQVELIDPFIAIKLVIVLEMDDENALIERLMRRARVEGRADDADRAVLKKRMEVYASKTLELLDHLPKERMIHVNAAQSPLEVFRDVLTQAADVLSERYCPPGLCR